MSLWKACHLLPHFTEKDLSSYPLFDWNKSHLLFHCEKSVMPHFPVIGLSSYLWFYCVGSVILFHISLFKVSSDVLFHHKGSVRSSPTWLWKASFQCESSVFQSCVGIVILSLFQCVGSVNLFHISMWKVFHLIPFFDVKACHCQFY